MKNLNEELRKLDEYNYKVSADFSKKVMKKIHKGYFTNSMKYVVSFASLAAVACFAVVLYTNPDLKGRFFKGATESEDFAFFESSENSSVNSSSINNAESFQDFTAIKESQTESMPFETEESKGINRVENNMMIDDKIVSNDEMTSEKDKTEAFESVKGDDVETAGASSISLKNALIQKLKKAGFAVSEVENGLKVKATKQELKDLLKDEKVELQEQKDGILIKLP